MSAEEMSASYARLVGERLRHIRRQLGLSLAMVEAATDREFKPSILGAYERGKKDIPLLRLHRLAQLYGVPIDQFLPPDVTATPSWPAAPRTYGRDHRDPKPGPVTIDLRRLKLLASPEKDLISRYVNMIQLERGDFNGRVLTLREHDLWALGRVTERDGTGMRERMGELGILY